MPTTKDLRVGRFTIIPPHAVHQTITASITIILVVCGVHVLWRTPPHPSLMHPSVEAEPLLLGLVTLFPNTSVPKHDLDAHQCLSPTHRCEETPTEAASTVGPNTISTVASNVRLVLGASLASVKSAQTVRKVNT
eukprot:6688890-Pyramimonas_sp.AAC.3